MASAYSILRGASSNHGGKAQAPQAQPPKGPASASTSSRSQSTVTALNRWSVLNKQLPAADKITALHVYDFDNTLFKTPLPNPTLWQGPTIGLLSSQDVLVDGGWWHDNRILAATGEGIEKEESRAWEGWWNEKIVELVRLSVQQPDALCVLLTGRAEQGFADLVLRITASKKLDFDMVSLKPRVSPTNKRFQSTMHFKQLFLEELMETYAGATEIKVYEDRPKHTKGFREFFAEYNRRQHTAPTRGPLQADVVQVADMTSYLDPVTEVAEVQQMINQHNSIAAKDASKRQLRIKKTVFFTSYMVNAEDTQRLIKLAQIPTNMSDQELKYHGNNILICPRPCPASILEKVGGMGSKMSWEVTGTACYDRSIWAACLRPVPQHAKYHTDNPVPLVVLALRKGAKPIDAGKIDTWQPVPAERAFVFETVVGEKVILRIEPDDPREDEYESLFANKSSKRKHAGDEGWSSRNQFGGRGGDSRGFHSGPGGDRGRPGRGGRGGGPGRGGGRGGPRGGGRGRGRGHFNNYRSLDDVDSRNQQGANNHVEYDDAYPPLGAPRQPSGNQTQYAWQSAGGPPSSGRPMGGQSSNGQDLQNYY